MAINSEKVYPLIDVFPYKFKNRDKFYQRNHPVNLNPDSYRYEEYWDEFIGKCVEGVWVDDDGTWVFMFPQLFFYINYVVLSNNGKIQPNLTDGEWIVFSYLMGVDGFYGFEDEPDYTCHDLIRRIEKGEELDSVELSMIPEACKKPDGSYKKFAYSWEYLTRIYLVDRPLGKPLGKALYDRPNNGFVMTGRSLGKSVMMFLGKYAHEWLFSGTRFLEDLYRLNDKYNYAMCCTTSEPLDRSLNAVAYFYANMPGSYKYPKSADRPDCRGAIYKRVQGKFKSGNTVEHITKNIDNTIDIQGSVMQAPVLKPDRLKVTSGDRFKLVLLEEAGFLEQILKFFGYIVDSLQSQGEKIGSFVGLGTGGDMKTIAGPRKISEEPEAFGMNSIPDYWTKITGKRITLFVPAEYSQKDYKDENGNTKLKLARAFLERKREKLKEEDLISYESEIQFNPFDPADMLRPSGRAWLPKQDSQKMLNKIEAHKLFGKYSRGWLEFIPEDPNRNVEFKYDIGNILNPICKTAESMDMVDKKGAVIIYEHPREKEVPGLYYVLYDPAAKSGDGESYHSMIVYKSTNSNVGQAVSNGIVAEWIGRLELIDDNYDMAIKLAKYYNCTVFCERNIQGFIEYVRRRNLYSILESSAVEAEKEISPNGKSSHYLVGWMMTTKYKIWALKRLKQWLLEPAIIDNDGFVVARVIDTIHSLRIHNEIVDHDLNGNFDHISSLLGLQFLLAKIDGEVIEVDTNEELIDYLDELERQQAQLNSVTEPICQFMEF